MRKISSMGKEGAAPQRKLAIEKITMHNRKNCDVPSRWMPRHPSAAQWRWQPDSWSEPGAFVGAGTQAACNVWQRHIGDGCIEHLHNAASATVIAISQGLTRGFQPAVSAGCGLWTVFEPTLAVDAGSSSCKTLLLGCYLSFASRDQIGQVETNCLFKAFNQ